MRIAVNDLTEFVEAVTELEGQREAFQAWLDAKDDGDRESIADAREGLDEYALDAESTVVQLVGVVFSARVLGALRAAIAQDAADAQARRDRALAKAAEEAAADRMGRDA